MSSSLSERPGAENVSSHPFEIWTHRVGTVTVANPSGFGGSPGRPRLAQLVDQAVATVDHVRRTAGAAPIVLSGSSLGGAVAICAAVRHLESGGAPAAIIVRDAPHLPQVIMSRFGWRSGWLPARMVSRSVPASLDIVEAAKRCHLPAVIITSLRDRVVPTAAQRIWIDQYAGPKRIVELAEAGHYDPMGIDGANRYRDALKWLDLLIR